MIRLFITITSHQSKLLISSCKYRLFINKLSLLRLELNYGSSVISSQRLEHQSCRASNPDASMEIEDDIEDDRQESENEVESESDPP